MSNLAYSEKYTAEDYKVWDHGNAKLRLRAQY
jgi:uncharacterized protein YutD